MDEASRHVAQFLSGLSEILWGPPLYGSDGLWGKLADRGIRPMPLRPGVRVSICGLHCGFGVYAEIAPDKWLEFEVNVVFRGSGWEVDTTVSVDRWPEEEGQRTLRGFPTRSADTLDDLLIQLRAAVVDLAACDDVLDELPETRRKK